MNPGVDDDGQRRGRAGDERSPCLPVHAGAALNAPRRWLCGWLAAALAGAHAQPAPGAADRVGIVLLHGIGATGAAMEPLAAQLRAQGWAVRTPDMPYGGPAAFSKPVAAAEAIVRQELQTLRAAGARRLVVAGFSLGGFFAAHMAGRETVDALVSIAPNGGADMKQLQDELVRARQLVAQGRGEAPTTMQDADVVGSARYPLPNAVPSAWITWFDPQGVMNWQGVWRRLRPGTPVFLVVPTRDLANLRRIKKPLWKGLPPHPANRLYEPRSDHLGASAASAREAVRWLRSTLAAPAR